MATYHRDRKSTSWVRTITSPFRKARTLFNQESSRDKKSHQEGMYVYIYIVMCSIFYFGFVSSTNSDINNYVKT